MLYIFIRTLVSGYTYKLFTFQGWADEMVNIMKIKRRVLALDYPRFWTEEQLAEREAKKAAEEQEAKEEVKDLKEMGKDGAKDIAKDQAVAEAVKRLPVFAWPVFGQFTSFVCEFSFELFGDFAFGFIVQLFAIGFAILMAEKALEKHNAKQGATGEEKATKDSASEETASTKDSEASADVAMDNMV